MKKLLMFALIAGLAFILISCNKQSSEYNPAALLTSYGPDTLTVHATYNGPAATLVSGGTGRIYVYLFDTLGLTSRDPVYSGSTLAAVTPGVEDTITIEHIKDGDYYVLVFYDYHGGDNPDNQQDYYMLYTSTGSTGFAGLADTFTVAGDTDLPGISFGSTYQLQAQSKYMLPCTVTVNATYNGTAATTGTGRLFVYLYDSLGADTRTPTPLYIGSTTGAATIGVQSQIVLTNITEGTYYAVLFYDYSAEAGHDDSAGDRYVIYNNRQYTSLADTITLGDGGSATWTQSFDDGYALETSGAYMTPSSLVSLTVKATYNGAVATTGTGNMYVYLYTTLKRGTRLSNDVFTPTYASTPVAATVGNEATCVINNIVQGSYYMVVFYDYASGTNADSPTDRYVLYSGAQYPSGATILNLTANTTKDSITFDNTNTFQTNVMGDTLYMQPGSLTVTATYNGTAGTGTDADANYIYVYLYDSLDASTATSGGTRQSGYYAIYTGSTGSAVAGGGGVGSITINNIAPGNYYMVVFYNWNAAGASFPDNKNDRYTIYNNVEFPATSGVATVPISSGSNSASVTIGNTWLLNSGSVFN